MLEKARYRVGPKDIVAVICHRRRIQEEFLVQWTSGVYSWHNLPQLTLCLNRVQRYVSSLNRPYATSQLLKTKNSNNISESRSTSRKRKAPGTATSSVVKYTLSTGLLTPTESAVTEYSSRTSRAPSVLTVSSHSSSESAEVQVPTNVSDPDIYNGRIERKAGRLIAKRCLGAKVPQIDSGLLPSREMQAEAHSTPIVSADRFIRDAFEESMMVVDKISLENEYDSTTPSLDFTFIKDFKLTEGTFRVDEAINIGCQLPCRPNMGQNIGCEYTAKCECLEFAAVDVTRLSEEQALLFKAQKHLELTAGLPKRFPYTLSKEAGVPAVLQKFYRESRHPIYECNPKCNCGPMCKSRLVQKGRQVPLTIFKTASRGWGVYCDEDLVKGEFVDTYLGEVITNDEADRREQDAGKWKSSYLYSLDKFVSDDDSLTPENCFVVDGQTMGNVTRFINHSCEPNLRQFTVSYNKYDLRLYELAFFTIEDIPKGTELTFDYMDKDEEEEADVARNREEAANDPANVDKVPCDCGTRKCRGYLWV